MTRAASLIGPGGRIGRLAVACLLLAWATPQAGEPTTPGPTAVPATPPPPPGQGPAIEDLGEQRYRIGTVLVDRAAGSLQVAGRVAHIGEALEYLAVSRGGTKEYESLLELQTTAAEFQLACILIGLDDADAVKPRYQFDERTVVGDPVRIEIQWQLDGEKRVVSAEDAILVGDKPFGDDGWAYIGSVTAGNNMTMAESSGTLIGFVHDPYAVIEHREGAGIGAYGSVTGNAELLPPEGTLVMLSVIAVRE